MNLQEKLRQGIDAAEAGHKQEARQTLNEVVNADENQLEAWLWLSQVVDSLEEKSICLENVLTLDPDHEFAQVELSNVKAQQEEFFGSIYAKGEEEPPANIITLPEAAKYPIVDEYPYKDEFDNVWLCPYCANPTTPEHRRCPTCRQDLISRTRIQPERSEWLWRAIFLQISAMMMLVAFGSSAFVLLLRRQAIPNPTPFLPLYFGQAIDAPLEVAGQTVLAAFPLWAFWGLVGVLVYTLLMMMLLYLRVPYGNVLYFISASISMVTGFFGVIFFYDSVITLGVSLFALLLGAAQFYITLNLWNDFTFNERRIQLKIDGDAKSHQGFYKSGRKYSKLGMWGLAVIHLRRAVAGNPNQTPYQLALALAYFKIKREELAEETLRRVQKSDPKLTEIEQLRTKLQK